MKRKALEAAREYWKEREFDLIARIQIEEKLLKHMRTELAEIDCMSDDEMLVQYKWLTPAEIEETMRNKREYLQRIEELACEGLQNWPVAS